IEGGVELVEGTGSEIYAKPDCKSDDSACLFRERLNVRFGDTIHIAIDPATVHLFDKDSGKRL
ncbi:MAG TPA: sugar ABC transporter ATP-binding protein, partial [Agrobacterium sp.]|nr:sugar ABC transporter ATP-binding protein [Agrobacterium sp.]